MRNINLILIFLYCTSTCIDNINATKPQLYPKYQSFIQRSKRDTSVSFNDTIEQLEQIASFVNGLILTEAVVEGTTNLSTLATDFLIIGQLPKGADWIEKVGSREVADGKTDQLMKLYGQTYQFRDILDHGLNSSIDVNVVTELVNAMKNLNIVDRIATNAQSLMELVQNFEENPEETDLTNYKNFIHRFADFPLLMRKLRKEPNYEKFIDLLPEALQTSFKVKAAGASKTLGFALNNHKMFTEQKDPTLKEACLTNLKTSLVGLAVNNFTFEAVDYLRNLFELAETVQNAKSIGTVEEFLGSVQQLYSRFSKMANTTASQTMNEESEIFSDMLNSLKKVKSADLDGMLSILQALTPVANVGKEMYNLFESNETALEHVNEAFVNKFISYSGFENGIDSFENMEKDLIVSNKLPIQFIYSSINYRSELVQKLARQLASVSQFSNGLPLVNHIIPMFPSIQKFKVPPNLESQLRDLKNFTNSLPPFKEISEVLGEFATRINFSREKDWKVNLQALETSFPILDFIAKYKKLLAPIPEVILFAGKLREALGDVLINTDEEEWKKDEIEKRFEGIAEVIEKIEKGKTVVETLEKASEGENSKNSIFKPSLIGLKDVIENSTLFKNWTDTNFNYTSDEIVSTLSDLNDITDSMVTLEARMHEINETIAELSKFEPLKELVSDTFDSNLAEPATKLIQSIVGAKFKDTELIDEPSEAMARLMNGSTFGAEILDDLRQGIIGYRSLLNGIESTTMLESYISTLNSNESELMGQVKKLLDGVERLQIVNPPFSNNALQYLDKFSKIVKNIESAVKWIRESQAADVAKTAKDLETLMSTTSGLETKDALQHLHSFISQINNSTAESFRRLKIGLEKFVDALSHGNSIKRKSQKNQKNGNNGSRQVIEIVTEQVESRISVYVWVGGIVSFVCILLSVGCCTEFYMIRRKEKKEKKKEEVNARLAATAKSKNTRGQRE